MLSIFLWLSKKFYGYLKRNNKIFYWLKLGYIESPSLHSREYEPSKRETHPFRGAVSNCQVQEVSYDINPFLV